ARLAFDVSIARRVGWHDSEASQASMGSRIATRIRTALRVSQADLLARWQAASYCLHFGQFLGGLARLSLPLPLGGTSNVFRVDRLREVGGWDPWNVTEDLDLGIR